MVKNIRKTLLIPVIILLSSRFTLILAQHSEIGMASYYANEFHGRKTASGEKYNMNELTAAHPNLPFQTLVRVTNLSNNKAVTVRINDRGPHSKSRIIDISKAAANEIGLIKQGIARVKIEVITKDSIIEIPVSEPKVPADTLSKTTPSFTFEPGNIYNSVGNRTKLSGYYIQTASYTDLSNAIEHMDKLKKDQTNEVYCEVAISKNKTIYRLLVGSFKTKPLADKELNQLKKSGTGGLVRKL